MHEDVWTSKQQRMTKARKLKGMTDSERERERLTKEAHCGRHSSCMEPCVYSCFVYCLLIYKLCIMARVKPNIKITKIYTTAYVRFNVQAFWSLVYYFYYYIVALILNHTDSIIKTFVPLYIVTSCQFFCLTQLNLFIFFEMLQTIVESMLNRINTCNWKS